MSKDRNCKMCVYYSENGCNQFNCQGTTTVDDIRAEERTKIIDLIDRHMWNYSKEVWEDFQPVLKQLKEQK